MAKRSLFIYATGLTAKHAYELVKDEEQYEFIAFLNRTLDQYNTVADYGECWLYTDSRITDDMKKNAIVIVAIMNTQGNIRMVMQRLKEEGFINIIPYAKLADIFPDRFHFLYLESKDKFKARMVQIEEARNILIESGADQRSMVVFDSMVKFRETKDYDVLPELDKKEDQYFPRDIPCYRTEKICFVDCGAYIGDTFDALLKYAEDVKSDIAYYAGFEPDRENYKELERTVRKQKNLEYRLYPYALCDEKRNLFFNMLGSTASSVENGDSNNRLAVTGMPLDEIEFSIIPSHIKMDIEGEEYNALLGADKLIREHKPALAICIYHRPEDIYDIIKLIDSWNLGYKFEMRVYEDVGVDLVLYAV